MPRLPLIEIPGVPLHIVQRGNNRSTCFFHEDNYGRYRHDLLEQSLAHGVAVHAYVLMTNHVHLLATQPERGAISRMMQALGRLYVGYVNATYRRSGTLWEGRFKSCVVESQQHVLECYRYIELNPVRAAMVDDPAAYRWSSYRTNALGASDRMLRPHPEYSALHADHDGRLAVYRALVDERLDPQTLADIRCYLQQQRVLGSPSFRVQIAHALGRRVDARGRGRPATATREK